MDQDTQRWLEREHQAWRRRTFGAAAIGCALMLGACGGGDEAEDTPADPPPKRGPICGEMREKCL